MLSPLSLPLSHTHVDLEYTYCCILTSSLSLYWNSTISLCVCTFIRLLCFSLLAPPLFSSLFPSRLYNDLFMTSVPSVPVPRSPLVFYKSSFWRNHPNFTPRRTNSPSASLFAVRFLPATASEAPPVLCVAPSIPPPHAILCHSLRRGRTGSGRLSVAAGTPFCGPVPPGPPAPGRVRVASYDAFLTWCTSNIES